MESHLMKGLQEIQLFDVHTHLDACHLSARGLHDILLYHMVVSDLYSAGCPDGARLTEDPSPEEIEERMARALPYLPCIENTSSYWGVRTILRDLYDWNETITAMNWRTIHGIIQERYAESDWSRSILRKANITRACTELWRRHDGRADDVMQYALEWAFFARCQWGRYDTALLELENAWNSEKAGAPLPVNMSDQEGPAGRRIRSLEDIHSAMAHYCGRIPYDDIISTAQHISTDIHYRSTTDAEMADALARRETAGPLEQDIYASYILEAFLTELEKQGRRILFQFSFGAEPLPFETGSKLRSETVFEVASLLSRHPGLSCQAFLSSDHQNQAMCTLARELPNLSMAGYWWHSFFPASIRKMMEQRLDMLPANKQVAFFSDAYCVDWAYAKAMIVRTQLAEVLASKIRQGQFTPEVALRIATTILNRAPAELNGMKPSL